MQYHRNNKENREPQHVSTHLRPIHRASASFLATKPEGVLARDVQDAAADILNLNEEQRAETIASGQLVYKNRTGWAHDRLKRAGLSHSLSRGKWCLTAKGIDWLKQHPNPLTTAEVEHLALAYTNVKLQQNSDAVDLDPVTEPLLTEAMLTTAQTIALSNRSKRSAMPLQRNCWRT